MQHKQSRRTSGNQLRFQYRLRTLLLMVSAMVVPLSWIGCERSRSAHQQVIARRIFELKGFAFFESDSNSPHVLSWPFRLRRAIIGERIVDVDLTETSLADVSMLSELTSLELLFLGDNEIEDIRPLGELHSLKHLSLYKTRVHDLSPLAALTNLESLNVRRTGVVDITPVTGLKKLKEVNLEDTLVQDVSPLSKLSSLKTIYLRGTPVSKEHVHWLRTCLPACNIDSDYSHNK